MRNSLGNELKHNKLIEYNLKSGNVQIRFGISLRKVLDGGVVIQGVNWGGITVAD